MPIQLDSWLRTYHEFIQMEFEELRRYADALEKLIEEEGRRFEKDLESRTSGMAEEAKFEFYEWASDDFYRLSETFPKIMRYSLFVHTYSLLEHSLLCLAEHFQHAKKLDLSPKELRDDGITRAKTYLRKVVRVAFPDTGAAWQEICTLNRIRNVVVHNSGHFPDDHSARAEIEAFVARWSSEVSFDNIGRFSFSASFVNRVIDTNQAFLKDLFANLAVPSH